MNAQALAPPPIGIEALLSRLERVHRTGNGWRANCPCGHRARGTLSIAVGDAGQILLHCFSCADTPAILAAVGLSMADVQPARLRDASPEGRRAARESFKLASTAAAASVLAVEASIVHLAARDLLRGDALAPEDLQRVRVAADRIASVREALR